MLTSTTAQCAITKTAETIRCGSVGLKFTIWFKVLLVALLLLPVTSFAQTYDLKPENWFPLEIGSTWHYKIEIPDGDTNNLIQKATRDSLIEGKKWTAIENVYCGTTRNCSTEVVRWYHFTEDDYLLINTPNPGFITADTILVSQPRSVFAANLPQDTLHSTRATDPVTVSLEINDEGNESDSTNFELFVTARENIYFTERFIYKIGAATRLIGAIVGDITYGDITLISSVALSNEAIPPSLDFELNIFPNPSSEFPTIRFQPPSPGLYKAYIYNVLGQKLLQRERRLSSNEAWRLAWSVDTPLRSGVYLVQIMHNDITQSIQAFTITK